MSRRAVRALLVGLVAAVVALGLALRNDDSGSGVAATADGGAGYAPRIDAARFTTEVDNPFFPLPPGARWVYEGQVEEGLERVEVVVTGDTRQVMGVTCVVVRDTVTLDGEMIEDTYDWYAQDTDGNVWYFGEDTREFEDGQAVSSKGSWEAGVDGAQPGIVMKAEPKVGDEYRQEYYEDEAEDMGEVLSLTEEATVRSGSYRDLLMTKDFTPLEPEVVEHKYYARGIGVVLEVKVEGGSERIELVETTRGS